MSSLTGGEPALRWWGLHLVLPLTVAGLAIAGLEATDLDARALEPFYDPALGAFPLRKTWLFQRALHEGGKWLVLAVTGALALLVIADLVWKRWTRWRGAAAYLVACVAATTGVVGWLKAVTNRYPPWDLDRFGGKVPFTPLFAGTPEPFVGGHGFPAGHAAGACAWVALYFVARSLGVRRPWFWLVPGLLLGVAFGLVQHVRGAHFPSHNLWTLAIAWTIALGFAALFTARGWLPAPPRRDPADDPCPMALGIAVRSWIAGLAGMTVGAMLFAIDTAVEALHLGAPDLHDWIECIEFALVGPGLGAVCLLLVERLRVARAASAARASQERERRFQVLGRMAAAVAHEVRNPLHTLRLVHDELCHDLPALRAHPLRGEIERNLERIDRAVELVYQLARPSADDERVLDLAATLADAVAGGRRAPGAFALAALPERAPVRASASGLRIALDNLLRNALEAGGGAAVAIALVRDGTAWLLTIENPGTLPAGVATGSLSDGADSRKSGGLGLGLAIARHLVGHAGGELALEQVGERVRASLRLPAAEGPA